MKYYSELRKLEDQIIRLDIVASLLKIIAEGSQNTSQDDVINSLWHITETVEDINAKASDRFQELWDNIRDEKEFVPPSKQSTELNDIVNSWARQ